MGALLPDKVGAYTYLVRASATGGRDWLYGGFRSGLSDGGVLKVVPSSDTTAPAAPTGLKVTAATPATISLAWDANAEADLYGYEIYRAVMNPVPLGDPGWIKAATIPAGTTQYVDREVNTGTTYEYYVMAVDTSYNRSAKSTPVSAKAESRLVKVTLNVTLPAFTPAADVIYLPGNQPAGAMEPERAGHDQGGCHALDDHHRAAGWYRAGV